MLEEVFIFNGNRCITYIVINLGIFYWYTLNGIVVFPEQCTASAVIIADASADVITTNIAKVGQVFTEIGEQAHKKKETSNKTNAHNLKCHDAAITTKPILVHSFRLEVI